MLRFLPVLPVIFFASLPATALACEKINSLPTVISSPGKYCLKDDFSLALMSGAAILVQSDHVTIDLEGYTIDNTAAGPTTAARGVSAIDQDNTMVRNGTIMGFSSAVNITPGATGGTESNTVEYIRAIDNIIHGIQAWGPGAVIRHNIVLNTINPSGVARGIESNLGVGANIVGNTVDNTKGNTETQGIQVLSSSAIVRDNRVTETREFSGDSYGIEVASAILRDNDVINSGIADGADVGISVKPLSTALCQGNLVQEFPTAISNCTNAGDNFPAIP